MQTRINDGLSLSGSSVRNICTYFNNDVTIEQRRRRINASKETREIFQKLRFGNGVPFKYRKLANRSREMRAKRTRTRIRV